MSKVKSRVLSSLGRSKPVCNCSALPIRIELTSFTARETEIFAIRYQVFHQEQQIDLALDFDGLDQEATQVVAFVEEQAAGTARVRRLGAVAKIERVAVLASYRQQGIGTAMIHELLMDLGPGIEVILNAQRASELFYRRMGFVPKGTAFLEAGIEHIQMHQMLTASQVRR